MELPEVVSVRKFKDFSPKQKEEVYETVLELARVIEELPKKSLRKTLDLTLAVLNYKGKQVRDLETELDEKDQGSLESHHDRLVDENEKLKIMLSDLEDERLEYKRKIKELTEEMFSMQKRLQEAAANAEGSDKDSSDPLSELDKQETLLRNINTKNKHIKRLLREIESLQNQNIEQSKSILTLEKDLQHGKESVMKLKADLTLVQSEKSAHKETIQELNIEIKRLEGNITYLEDERERSEGEVKEFVEKLEKKAVAWKKIIEEKDKQLKKLKVRNERPEDAQSSKSSETKAESEESDEQEERSKLLHSLECRDKLIEQLELKIKTMAEEMIASTKLMNKITAEREHERNPQNPRSCCKSIEMALKASNDKCRDLTEMLEKAEEECCLKAKQSLEACAALTAYQKGEDGLLSALRKCSSLENKLQSRDKQIRALVMELNSMHEIAQENTLLRKRLNIPDDVVITTKNLSAKERSKEKMIEKLTLKLRASEEMRLQLKMEKCDLRKEILDLQHQHNTDPEKRNTPVKPVAQKQTEDNVEQLTKLLLKSPKNSPKHTDHLSRRSSREVGELEDSSNSAEASLLVTVCSQCQGNLRVELQDYDSRESQMKYQEAWEENEILRQGMLEILEKLREYDDCSENITINDVLLLRLIRALKVTNTPTNSPKRLRDEVKMLKEREKSLVDRLAEQQKLQQENSRDNDSEELNSVESLREEGEIKQLEDPELELPQYLDSSTRPTTPTRSLNIPNIQTPQESVSLVEQRKQEMELADLKIYKKYYEELKLHMNANEGQAMQTCSKLTEQIVHLELQLQRETKSSLYMREDFDKNLTDLKNQEIKHIEREGVLKLEIARLKDALETMNRDLDYHRDAYIYNKDDYTELQQSFQQSQMQMAFLTQEILTGRQGADMKIPEMCMDYGIILDDLQLSFITQQEFEAQKLILKDFEGQRSELQRKIAQLESLLDIAQDQIGSQQRLLNDITDNHINLRHLVADLQSSTEEKLLMAKMQRDLDAAKSEITQLKYERDALKQHSDSLQQDLISRDHLKTELTKSFQIERQNNYMKIKFLQKSLNCLREKYAKFTPLVFLTNFVFSYNRFLQKSSTNTSPKDAKDEENLQRSIEEVVGGLLKAKTEQMEDNQQLIKLIKTETQCKLYEDQIKQLEKKCSELEKDLNELKLKMATETEHWHTIEALFGKEKPSDEQETVGEQKPQETTKEDEVRTKEIGCNTESDIMPTPVPAERKLSANRARRVSIEMVDKNMSPIQTPTKKAKREQAAQTEESKQIINPRNGDERVEPSNKSQSQESVNENSTQSPKKEEIRTTSEVEIQTCNEPVSLETKSVQTQQIEEGTEGDAATQAKPNGSELKEALIKLKSSEERLSQAKQQIEDLEKQLGTLKDSQQPQLAPNEQSMPSLQSDVIEKTILSFHTLLSEKDKSIGKYQDILQTEREQSHLNVNKLTTEIEGLKSTITNLNFNIKTKDIEILELKTQMEATTVRRNSNEKLQLAQNPLASGEENVDNSLNEMTDEKIEELFEENLTPGPKESPVKLAAGTTTTITEKHELEKDIPENFAKQLKELKEKAGYWESSLKVKEDEIAILREKIRLLDDREKSASNANNPEMDQLRSLLDEKDRHINELMDTLNNFHDDQQRYINDSSNYSADQIAKLASDLTRTEATNKIYQTQVEALRKQLTSLTQREKQARELNQSLRQQLIKRPVVSIKTELNARVKNENLQKRLQQLDMDLEDARAEIQRQKVIIESKRARSANEVGLWEKQKRWQQSAEKFKAKLEETEIMLDKNRCLLKSARTTINRLEKDKQILEAKLGRVTHHNVQNAMKCCRTPSCPNLHHHASAGPTGGVKYTPSESPETYTGASSECSSPGRSSSVMQPCSKSSRFVTSSVSMQNPHDHDDIIQALKARIEMQQRKILALELEGKGSNALTTEMEKLQEKLSATDAQNIRLEAKNLQLQLDNDLLRQGDGTERLQKRIKHLEDYIIALKEERASSEARRELCKCSGIKLNIQSGQSAEHTILSLRNIVEKLRAENKYLKDGRRSCESRTSTEVSGIESTRLQQMYTESMDKIAALQQELTKQPTRCPHCENKNKMLDTSPLQDELRYVKEQLIKKTQLLQKAKVLLTRAAAKEKVLKEQLSMWKRKCSELQNVPVIDEISE